MSAPDWEHVHDSQNLDQNFKLGVADQIGIRI